jgi:hypothetical protein
MPPAPAGAKKAFLPRLQRFWEPDPATAHDDRIWVRPAATSVGRCLFGRSGGPSHRFPDYGVALQPRQNTKRHADLQTTLSPPSRVRNAVESVALPPVNGRGSHPQLSRIGAGRASRCLPSGIAESNAVVSLAFPARRLLIA